MKREATSVFVRTEWLEIPTEEDVSIVDTIKALIYLRDNKFKYTIYKSSYFYNLQIIKTASHLLCSLAFINLFY